MRLFEDASQQPGAGTLGIVVIQLVAASRPWRPARTKASYKPVFTASPPFVSTNHQSTEELSYALAEVNPSNRRCFPSGDQMG